MKNFIIFFFIFFFFSLNLFSQEPNTVVEVTKEVVVKDYYEISSIPDNSAKTLQYLSNIEKKLEFSKQISEIHKTLPTFIDSIEKLLKSKEYQNLESLNIREIQKIYTELSVYIAKLNEWDKDLKVQIQLYDEKKETVKNYLIIWKKTKLYVNENDVPKAIKEHINLVIKSVELSSKKVKDNYNQVLTDSSQITTKNLIIQKILEQLKINEQKIKNKIFYQNKPLFLEILEPKYFEISGILDSIESDFKEDYKTIDNYFIIHSELVEWLFIYVIVLGIFIAYYYYMYILTKLFIFQESRYKKRFRFIRLPISTYLIICSLSVILIFPDRTKSINDMILLILLIPTLRIIGILFSTRVKKYLYIFFIIFVFSLLKNSIIDFEFYSRVFSMLLDIAFILTLVYFLKNQIIKNIFSSTLNDIIKKFLFLFIFLNTIAVMANFYGAVLLSHRIEQGVLLSLYISLVFYVIYIVLSGYIILILRRRISTASYMLEKYSRNLESTAILLIKIVLIIWWTKLLLTTVGLYQYVVVIATDSLALSWSISSSTISVQSIVDFLLVVFTTWALAKIIKIILEVEIFARFKFPRGIPTAITTTLNYSIIITGTIIAFSSLGVSSQQFTLVFGALGVGIGFGLRNIIANFISGIIMVFERPIQIGDTIEIANTMGDVQSIGARSSTIKTYDGSEVIIPNADFISKEITNWTLSDNRRRKSILFKIDFDSDIGLILKIMKEIAISHDDVLKEPEPLAAFLGFGEYYLEFKLYFWLSDNIIVAQSELAISIYKALKKEGIKMPIPKATHLIKEEI